jgi:hypothetical protein
MKLPNLSKKIALPLVFFVAVLIRFIYGYFTDPRIRSYDIYMNGGHFDYIHFLTMFRGLPDPSTGWEYFQPPLYYFFGTTVLFVNEVWLHLSKTQFETIFELHDYFAFWQKGLVVLFSVIFVWYGYKTIKLFKLNFWLESIAFLGLALWPSGILHSSRIGNDSLFYAIFAMGFYYICKFQKDNKNNSLVSATISTCLAVVTKSNGLILVPILVLVIFQNNLIKSKLALDINSKVKHEKTWHWKKTIFTTLKTLFYVGIAYSVNLGRTLYSSIVNGTNWLVSSSETISETLSARNGFGEYLTFDPIAFLSTVFVDTRYDEQRHNFWYFLLKSSLFGEFDFQTSWQRNIAVLLQFFVLVLVLFFIILFFQDLLHWKKNTKDKSRVLLWFTALLMLGSLIFYRLKLPFTSNNDFRYIFPVLIPVSILIFQKPIKDFGVMKELRYVIATVLVFVSVLSFSFFAFHNYSQDPLYNDIPSLLEDEAYYTPYYKKEYLSSQNANYYFEQIRFQKLEVEFVSGQYEFPTSEELKARITVLPPDCKVKLFQLASGIYRSTEVETAQDRRFLQETIDNLVKEKTEFGDCLYKKNEEVLQKLERVYLDKSFYISANKEIQEQEEKLSPSCKSYLLKEHLKYTPELDEPEFSKLTYKEKAASYDQNAQLILERIKEKSGQSGECDFVE